MLVFIKALLEFSGSALSLRALNLAVGNTSQPLVSATEPTPADRMVSEIRLTVMTPADNLISLLLPSLYHQNPSVVQADRFGTIGCCVASGRLAIVTSMVLFSKSQISV